MEDQENILKIEDWVKQKSLNETTGHDWYHLKRVANLAKDLLKYEEADEFIVIAAALLHDLADDKLVENVDKAMEQIEMFLLQLDVSEDRVATIMDIIKTISFKGGHGEPLTTIEAKIVQDADRLDALGAIGIARTFQYGGAKGQAMYDPTMSVREEMSAEEYRQGKSTSINHFYEKLLLLKDYLNTDRAVQLAKEREDFMRLFLKQFYKEWNSEI